MPHATHPSSHAPDASQTPLERVYAMLQAHPQGLTEGELDRGVGLGGKGRRVLEHLQSRARAYERGGRWFSVPRAEPPDDGTARPPPPVDKQIAAAIEQVLRKARRPMRQFELHLRCPGTLQQIEEAADWLVEQGKACKVRKGWVHASLPAYAGRARSLARERRMGHPKRIRTAENPDVRDPSGMALREECPPPLSQERTSPEVDLSPSTPQEEPGKRTSEDPQGPAPTGTRSRRSELMSVDGMGVAPLAATPAAAPMATALLSFPSSAPPDELTAGRSREAARPGWRPSEPREGVPSLPEPPEVLAPEGQRQQGLPRVPETSRHDGLVPKVVALLQAHPHGLDALGVSEQLGWERSVAGYVLRLAWGRGQLDSQTFGRSRVFFPQGVQRCKPKWLLEREQARATRPSRQHPPSERTISTSLPPCHRTAPVVSAPREGAASPRPSPPPVHQGTSSQGRARGTPPVSERVPVPSPTTARPQPPEPRPAPRPPEVPPMRQTPPPTTVFGTAPSQAPPTPAPEPARRDGVRVGRSSPSQSGPLPAGSSKTETRCVSAVVPPSRASRPNPPRRRKPSPPSASRYDALVPQLIKLLKGSPSGMDATAVREALGWELKLTTYVLRLAWGRGQLQSKKFGRFRVFFPRGVSMERPSWLAQREQALARRPRKPRVPRAQVASTSPLGSPAPSLEAQAQALVSLVCAHLTNKDKALTAGELAVELGQKQTLVERALEIAWARYQVERYARGSERCYGSSGPKQASNHRRAS
jgi:hypothetical protein